MGDAPTVAVSLWGGVGGTTKELSEDWPHNRNLPMNKHSAYNNVIEPSCSTSVFCVNRKVQSHVSMKWQTVEMFWQLNFPTDETV